MNREMRHSGVQWIGDIPKEWKMPRLKNVAELHGRIGWNGLRSDEFEEDSYAYLVTGQDFISSEISWDKCYQIRRERYDEDPFIQLNNGEILVTKDGTIGKIAIVSKMDKPGCLNSGIFVLRQKNEAFVPKFLYWQLYSSLLKTYNDYMNLGGTTIIHLYQNVFERMPLLTPSLSEQQKIADYLDKVCSDIDDMITLQEQMIEELKAYKQSIITEAVTKGLNPNVPMKNSGIDWIGEIPKHWLIMKLKGCVNSIKDVDHYMPVSIEKGIPYIMTRDLNDRTSKIDFGQCKQISNEDYYKLSKKVIIRRNDVIYARYATIGTICLVDTDDRIIVSYSCVIINPSDKVESLFLFYYLKSKTFEEEALQFVNTNIQGNIGIDSLSKTKMILPPLSEQQQIASHLDTKCSEIDSLITIKQQKIEELKEYKKSVIYEYVTGKKEVV